jgi:hypothetical protein
MWQQDLQEQEGEFRRFMQSLLNAQKYDFVVGRDLFSDRTLAAILTEFCNIIAENLGAESCTVQLQLYNPRSYMPDEDLKTLVSKIAEKFGVAEEQMFLENRKKWFKDTLTYPYWWRPKGAVRLVAANGADKDREKRDPTKTSKWCMILDAVNGTVADKQLAQNAITSLDSGITKEIIQGNVPRIRDRRSIRASRDFRKLGTVDVRVWTNESWSAVFRNYYGVPIRIHSEGEVIGVLKVENKIQTLNVHAEVSRYPDDEMPKNAHPENLHVILWEDTIKDDTLAKLRQELLNAPEPDRPILELTLEAAKSRPYGFWIGMSLFALAYLEADLETAVKDPHVKGLKLGALIHIPYPLQKSAAVHSLHPAGRTTRAPIQVLFDGLPAERELWKLIVREPVCRKWEPQFVGNLYGMVQSFYSGMLSAVARAAEHADSYPVNAIGSCLETHFHDSLNTSDAVTVTPTGCFAPVGKDGTAPYGKYPDFCFRVTIGSSDNELTFYVLVPPTRAELEGSALSANSPSNGTESKHWEYYRNVNAAWLGRPATQKYASQVRYSGEYVHRIDPDLTKRYRATDLIIDRLAARTQAFVDARCLPEFNEEDARKLGWAALEIGKLIERQISYRANNRADDPMPLTALEFYRIPISDLSFVDDLRHRRDLAGTTKLHADYHLQMAIRHLGLKKNHVAYTSRVKDYRSSLLRLGERYTGHFRGNLAVWFYLLALTRERSSGSEELKLLADKRNDPDPEEHFVNRLHEFRERVDEAVMLMFSPRQGSNKNPSSKPRKLLEEIASLNSKPEEDLIQRVRNCLEDRLNDVSRDPEVLLLELRVPQLLASDPTPLLGDLKFDSPPFAWTEDPKPPKPGNRSVDLLDRAIRVILGNLNCEGERLVPDRCQDFWFKATVDSRLSDTPEGGDSGMGRRPDTGWPDHESNANKRITPKQLEDFTKRYDTQLDNMVLRHYEDYVRCGSSLLIQLLNIKAHGVLARAFQAASHALRAKLCTSPREIEDDPQFFPLKRVFSHPVRKAPQNSSAASGNPESALASEADRPSEPQRPASHEEPWPVLTAFVNNYATDDIEKAWKSSIERPLMAITCVSIYKRLRALNNILRHQRSAAALDWDLGRFDLVGSRLNCLFKREVFATYETAWGMGDPFLISKDDAASPQPFVEEGKDFAQDPGNALDSKSRTRWLCARTVVQKGGYNAIQITALMDPSAVEPGSWDRAGLNLLRMRVILRQLLERYDPAFLEQYQNYSFHRMQLLRKQKDWHTIASAIEDSSTGRAEDFAFAFKRSRLFGIFPGEGVIDALLFLLPHHGGCKSLRNFDLSCHADPLRKIVSTLPKVCKFAQKYTDGFLVGVLKSNYRTSVSDKLRKAIIALYAVAVELLGEVGTTLKKVENPQSRQDVQIVENLVRNLEKERVLFEELLNSPNQQRPDSSVPLFFLPGRDAGEDIAKELDEIEKAIQGLTNKAQLNKADFWHPIVHRLKRLRTIQRGHFEYLGRPGQKAGGLWLREKDQVLERIKNLLFLFPRPQAGVAIPEQLQEQLRGLTSYDLFHYVRSLIPVEIQFRTKLADTVAEQYHDGVYKGQPPERTVVERNRLEEAGEDVDEIDRELEANYDDFVVKFCFDDPTTDLP